MPATKRLPNGSRRTRGLALTRSVANWSASCSRLPADSYEGGQRAKLYCVFSPRRRPSPRPATSILRLSSSPLRSAISGPSPQVPALSPTSPFASLDLASLSKRLNLRYRGEEDVALELLVRELLLDVAEDGRDEVALLLLTELGLVADVRVEDRLDLGGDRGLLLQAEGLVLELGGLLLGRGNDVSILN